MLDGLAHWNERLSLPELAQPFALPRYAFNDAEQFRAFDKHAAAWFCESNTEGAWELAESGVLRWWADNSED